MQTVLLPQHQALQATIVDFAGWQMPLHYGSQIDEHHSVRKAAGIFDVSHMGVVDITGPHAEAFLRQAFANDVHKLTDLSALYTCMLNPEGGVIDDLIVYRLTQEHYRLVINASRRSRDVSWLNTLAENDKKINICVLNDMCILSVQGPQALALCAPLLSPKMTALKPFHCMMSDHIFIARTGYTGEPGIEVVLPAKEAQQLWSACLAAGIRPCGLGARNTLRLEAGYNLYGNDMDEQTSPVIAGLSWTVCLKDAARNFVGKDAFIVAERKLTERMTGVIMQTPGVLRDNQQIITNSEVVGRITSGGFSPTLGHAIAMARLTPAAMQQPLYVDRRGSQVLVKHVKLPFVKNGQKTF